MPIISNRLAIAIATTCFIFLQLTTLSNCDNERYHIPLPAACGNRVEAVFDPAPPEGHATYYLEFLGREENNGCYKYVKYLNFDQPSESEEVMNDDIKIKILPKLTDKKLDEIDQTIQNLSDTLKDSIVENINPLTRKLVSKAFPVTRVEPDENYLAKLEFMEYFQNTCINVLKEHPLMIDSHKFSFADLTQSQRFLMMTLKAYLSDIANTTGYYLNQALVLFRIAIEERFRDNVTIAEALKNYYLLSLRLIGLPMGYVNVNPRINQMDTLLSFWKKEDTACEFSLRTNKIKTETGGIEKWEEENPDHRLTVFCQKDKSESGYTFKNDPTDAIFNEIAIAYWNKNGIRDKEASHKIEHIPYTCYNQIVYDRTTVSSMNIIKTVIYFTFRQPTHINIPNKPYVMYRIGTPDGQRCSLTYPNIVFYVPVDAHGY